MIRYIFNPEHDLCLADGREDYIPPASAVEFAEQCRWVERFMGPVGAVSEEIIPWGWNRALRKKLLQEGVPAKLLPDDAYLDFIRHNSRREVAVELLERLCGSAECASSQTPVCRMLTHDYRIVARRLSEIETFVAENGSVVLKAPLSGSGKGVRLVTEELMESDRGWCRRILERQGTVIVEKRLEVVQEMAMLFEYDVEDGALAGNDVDVCFRGYSLFYAVNGAYRGNILASNGYMENFIQQWISAEMLEEVRCGVERFLKEKLCGRGFCRLRGYVGVDQFVCRMAPGGPLLYNPAVEINLRMTMGHIARNICDLHSEELGLGEGTHCFEPLRGIFLCGKEADAADQKCSV